MDMECEPNVYVSNMTLIGFPDSPGDIYYNVPNFLGITKYSYIVVIV